MVQKSGNDWERRFGEKWSAMTSDERNMAIYIAISDLTTAITCFQKEIECVKTHKLYFKLIGAGFGFVVAPVFVWWIIHLLGI